MFCAGQRAITPPPRNVLNSPLGCFIADIRGGLDESRAE
jgi:hypothetical protein